MDRAKLWHCSPQSGWPTFMPCQALVARLISWFRLTAGDDTLQHAVLPGLSETIAHSYHPPHPTDHIRRGDHVRVGGGIGVNPPAKSRTSG